MYLYSLSHSFSTTVFASSTDIPISLSPSLLPSYGLSYELYTFRFECTLKDCCLFEGFGVADLSEYGEILRDELLPMYPTFKLLFIVSMSLAALGDTAIIA